MGRIRHMRELLERLARDGEGRVLIPQADGSIARFSEAEAEDALRRSFEGLRAKVKGAEPPPLHPMQSALKNAAVPESWHGTFLLADSKIVRRPGSTVELEEVEDLSEP